MSGTPGILADWEIRLLAEHAGMIDPLSEPVRGPGTVSYGLDSYGYDFRLAPEIWIFTDTTTGGGLPVDPKAFDERLYTPRKLNGPYAIPPHGFVMGRSIERFRIPPDVLVLGAGKTTYARSGVFVQTTPLNPGWEGVLMLAIHNVSPHPVLVYPGEGIAKLVFFRASSPCGATYPSLGGKYQGQEAIIGPRV